MSLACIACRGTDSPTHSLRSYSASSSDAEGGRCAAAVSCLRRNAGHPAAPAANASSAGKIGAAKVAPLMVTGIAGAAEAPRLVRSRAVTRDLVRDWNFDQQL